MRINRNVRLGCAVMVLAAIGLIIFLFVRARNSRIQSAEEESLAANSALTAVAVKPISRMSAVAMVDLPERSIITPGMFRLEELPEGASPAIYVTNLDANAIGFITRRRILKNERLRPSDLLGHISEVGIAGALSPGTRAMILPVPTKPTFHDLVRIGDYVDIIAAFDGQESRTIVESVRVLAVDIFGSDYPQQASVAMRGAYKAPTKNISEANPSESSASATQLTGNATTPSPAPAETSKADEAKPDQPPPPPPPAITLEVTPEQANRISLAQNSGGTLDFILVPRPLFIVPGAMTGAATARPASITRSQLAPYAESKKVSGTAKKTGNSANDNKGRSRYGGARAMSDIGEFPAQVFPSPARAKDGKIPPAGVIVPTSRPSYDIPIYADGTKVRTDTVLKPQE